MSNVMYHVNTKTGKSGICGAEKGKCPFKHFSTLAEAEAEGDKIIALLVSNTSRKESRIFKNENSIIALNTVNVKEKDFFEYNSILKGGKKLSYNTPKYTHIPASTDRVHHINSALNKPVFNMSELIGLNI